jgi:hypothetical protein
MWETFSFRIGAHLSFFKSFLSLFPQRESCSEEVPRKKLDAILATG